MKEVTKNPDQRFADIQAHLYHVSEWMKQNRKEFNRVFKKNSENITDEEMDFVCSCLVILRRLDSIHKRSYVKNYKN